MRPVALLRWTARIWSLASFAFIAVFVVGHGGFPITPQALFFPIGVLAGLAIAWWREGIGGAVALASLLAFYLWELAAAGRPPGGPYFLLIAAPGALFLASRWLDLGHAKQTHAA